MTLSKVSSTIRMQLSICLLLSLHFGQKHWFLCPDFLSLMQLSKIFSPTKKCKRKMAKNPREEMKWMQKDWPSCCWTIDKRIRIRPASFFASVHSSIVRWEVGNRKEMRVVAARSFVFHAAAPWVYASSQPWKTFTGIQFNWVRETPICQHIENSNLSNS